jgi:hypothetical protein
MVYRNGNIKVMAIPATSSITSGTGITVFLLPKAGVK